MEPPCTKARGIRTEQMRKKCKTRDGYDLSGREKDLLRCGGCEIEEMNRKSRARFDLEWIRIDLLAEN